MIHILKIDAYVYLLAKFFKINTGANRHQLQKYPVVKPLSNLKFDSDLTEVSQVQQRFYMLVNLCS